MKTFITLINYTPQGIADIKESPARLDAARKLFAANGANLKQWFLTFGKCDAVVVFEAPDDDTAAKLVLKVASLGNVKFETMPAFTEDEYRKVIASIP